MRFIETTNRSILWVMSLLLFFSGVATPSWAVDFQNCRNCHQQELAEAELRLVQHEPFMQQECAACHVVANLAAGLQSAAAPLLTAKKASSTPAKVTWLAESAQLSSEHSFVFSAKELGNRLLVDLRGEQENYPRQQIDLPPFADLTAVDKADEDPAISSVEVLEVKRGVFLSVLIGWQTDTLTDSSIQYGIQALDQKSKPTPRFGHSHRVRLYGLKADEHYQYQIVATDLFGRVQKSEVFSFSTEKPFAMPAKANDRSQKVELETKFERLGNDYLVHLHLNQPVSVFVGTSGEALSRQTVATQAATAEAAHEGLSSGIDLEIAACLNCHRDQGQTTHPVNVLPKPGMVIPEEYPTLPDGRISCASCHLTHSSNNPYLSIRRGKRELCVGCHKDML